VTKAEETPPTRSKDFALLFSFLAVGQHNNTRMMTKD
jgi:hypothetical protein